MSLTITSASPANLAPTRPASPPTAVAAPPPATSGAPSSAQETAELTQLLGKYKNDLAHGQSAGTLSGLGRQIIAAAKDAGQHVVLPRAPANSGLPAAPPVKSTAPQTGKLDVTT